MSSYPLLSVIGIEIEYMLVDCNTLNVRPISDIILQELAGVQAEVVEMGDIALSNELVLHVLEFKNNGPKPIDAPLGFQFQQAIETLHPVLQQHNLQLLPTGAHPWMNPLLETKRWPHGNNAIYQQYDAIFDCRGHGWSNLQSMHVNLPFANDEEFNQLHNAVRLLLPLLPALAASTPYLERSYSGWQCNRLQYYDTNQARIPAISGDIIPEFVGSEQAYKETILQPMYAAISSFDPEKLLQYEWLNSRAAIPKFDYNALEIRIIDTQECTSANIAIARAVWAIVSNWIEQSDYYLANPCSTLLLKDLYHKTKKDGLAVAVDGRELIQQWQLPYADYDCRQIWYQLIDKASSKLDLKSQRALEHMLSHGNLSQRLVRTLGASPSRDQMHHTYQRLAHCLRDDAMF